MKRLRHTKGISLLEVLASVAMFLIIAAGLASVTVSSIRAARTSQDTAAAVALVNNKIEQFRALDPGLNPPDLQAGNHFDPRNPLNPLGQPGGRFTRAWEVAADIPRRGLSRVVVTVSWNGPEPGSVSGVAYVCRTPTCSS